MRIVKFTAENVKKLRAVEITPAGDVVEVTGPNGSGKSSVLDAIFYALGGTAALPSAVIRQGEDHAVVKLDLGELLVTRRFTKSGTTLTVEATSGARFPSPQRMLDDLVGSLSFDPLEFTRLKPKEQLDALRSLVKIPGLEEIEIETLVQHEKVLAFNRQAKEHVASLARVPSVADDTPDEPVDVMTLVQKLQQINDANAAIKTEQRRRDDKKTEHGSINITAAAFLKEAGKIVEEAEEQCRRIMSNAANKREEHVKKNAELVKRAEAIDEELLALPPLAWPVDAVDIMKQIEDSKSTNQLVECKKRRRWLGEELKKVQDWATQANERVAANVKQRAELLAATTMPVEGLSFSSAEVLFNGLPLTVASSGEQLRVSVALAMAANPKLRVIRVKDGSLLDESNLKLLSSMAAAHDYQVWVERVEDGHGRPCVVMEDGAVHA